MDDLNADKLAIRVNESDVAAVNYIRLNILKANDI